MKDIKYILVILGFDLCYSYIFKGRFEVNDIISILLILTFSIYICGTIITYKFNLTYTDNLHKNLTLAFLAIGIVAFSYFYVLRIGINSDDFWGKATRVNVLFAVYESLCIALAIKGHKIDINFNKAFFSIILISLFVSYLGIRSNFYILLKIENDKNFIFTYVLKFTSILIKFYVLKLLCSLKLEISEYLYRYLSFFLINRIIMQFSSFIPYEPLEFPLIIFNSILLCIVHYIVLKIMISEIVKNPYYNLYKNLIVKSENLKKTSDELIEANYEKELLFLDFERSKQQEELKNELLANISHEFKTPINVIYSAIQTQELLQDYERSDGEEKYTDIIKQNCNRLIRLINNFIDTTRLDKGIVEPDFKLFNIVSLTEKIVMSIVPYAESKNLEVTFDTTDEELFSFMDEILYERILLNLLSNSIKYSKDKGDINIYVNNVKDKVQIVVEDHGIGMNDEDLKIIFNRFERIDKTLSRKTEGSGLGLHIVKGIVNLLEGSINVTSEKNMGTVVQLEFNQYKPTKDEMNTLITEEFLLSNQKHETEIEMSDIYI